MPNDQTSMFSYFDAASIEWFPIARRQHVIRGVAARLLGIDEPDARLAPWRREREKLAAEMQALGLAPARIESELKAFFDAVDYEMRRPSAGQASGSSGEGAA
ncbi:DUF6074 family protein [Mesorhizobium sp. Mes31]|uniref:DUF6074 family protein n=1 Tax=Mesorhizobium sp. Mes31 TaxID=2926017 RepID=UPI0021175ECE|nr:DUF6074 family protein [Mesorhizobium sp. Mes31]